MNEELIGCVLFDKISKKHVAFSFCNSKAEYLRSNVESAIMQYKNLNDLQPKVICKYNYVTGVITPMNEEFSFSEYKMPMSKAEALSPLGPEFTKDAIEYAEWKAEREKKLSKKE